MSNYNPVPTRAWSRVQRPCTYIVPGTNYSTVIIPATGQVLTSAQAILLIQQFYKGNILQYKANSARLTKSQQYSRVSNGFSNSRTKTFATQTQTYTNPNTFNFVRSGYYTYTYPNFIVGAPNNVSGPFQPNVPSPTNCPSTDVKDGGTLVAGEYADPCTNQIIKTIPNSATICSPMSASDVPGYGVLCWNRRLQSYFPKTNYVNNNSGNKWPQGYKGLVSAVDPQKVVDCLTA